MVQSVQFITRRESDLTFRPVIRGGVYLISQQNVPKPQTVFTQKHYSMNCLLIRYFSPIIAVFTKTDLVIEFKEKKMGSLIACRVD